VSPTLRDEPPAELPDVEAGLLPSRYRLGMQEVFLEHLRPLLVPGVAILDVGSGRSPTIAPDDRPADCRYTGLDVSADELGAAAEGSYDDTVVADIGKPLPIRDEYDVVISWQVLEHVKPIDRALESLRAALKPGGTMLAQLSGSRAAFALLARVLPHRVRVVAMSRLLGHPPEEKFPTYYDRCTATALRRMLASWTSAEIIPFYRGAVYFSFWRPLQRLYLAYETRVSVKPREDFATHYLIVATR
jgi:SAM-dependent methyltransferase